MMAQLIWRNGVLFTTFSAIPATTQTNTDLGEVAWAFVHQIVDVDDEIVGPVGLRLA